MATENINIGDITIEASVSNKTTIKEEKSEFSITVEPGAEEFSTVTAAIGKTTTEILESDQVIIIGEEARSFLTEEPVTEEESITANTDVEKSTTEVFELEQRTIVEVKDLQSFLTEEPVTEESITTNTTIEEETTEVLESIKIATIGGGNLHSFYTDPVTEESITTTATTGKTTTDILESDQVIIIGRGEAQSFFIEEPVTEESITTHADIIETPTKILKLNQVTTLGYKDLQASIVNKLIAGHMPAISNAVIQDTTTEISETVQVTTNRKNEREYSLANGEVTTTGATIGGTTTFTFQPDQVTTNEKKSDYDYIHSWLEDSMSEETTKKSFNLAQEITSIQKQLQTSSTVRPGTKEEEDEDDDMTLIDFEDEKHNFIFNPSSNKICPDGLDLVLGACRRTI